MLGEGQYGQAFLVQNLTSHEMNVMKVIDMSGMDKDEKRATLLEARIL